ncbi:MAG: hypothetical protein RR311_08940 [Comamonas sp.]
MKKICNAALAFGLHGLHFFACFAGFPVLLKKEVAYAKNTDIRYFFVDNFFVIDRLDSFLIESGRALTRGFRPINRRGGAGLREKKSGVCRGPLPQSGEKRRVDAMVTGR